MTVNIGKIATRNSGIITQYFYVSLIALSIPLNTDYLVLSQTKS